MDKALEKINTLLKEVEDITIQITKIETLQQQNATEIRNLKTEKDRIISEKTKLKELIEHTKHIKENINSWKKKTIILTSLILSFHIAYSTLVVVKLGFLDFLPFLYAFLIPYSFFLGEHKDYYKHKKYLKKYVLEELEKNDDELVQQLVLINEKINNINKSNNELHEKKADLLNKKDVINKKIENIKKMRVQVTEEFLTNNSQFEEIVNNAFDNFENTNQQKK